MNEVMKNILTRRSTRKFTDEQVPKEILKDIVDAALHAPSGMESSHGASRLSRIRRLSHVLQRL